MGWRRTKISGTVSGKRSRQFPHGLCAAFATLLALNVGITHARTNVLFIDLNNADAEIRAVRSALPRNSALFVIPSSQRFDARQRDDIVDVQRRIVTTTQAATLCPPSRVAECRVLWGSLRQLETERAGLTGHYDIEHMLEDLNQIPADAINAIDIVVISGHHSNGYFRGEIAQMDIHDLVRIDAEFPATFGRVRTLILLGCDTGTPALFSEVFARLFPLTRWMVGSEDSAPTRDEARNLRFINSVMRHESSMQQTRRRDDVARVHRLLLAQSWPVAMLWDRQHYFSRGWSGWLGAAAGLRMTRSLSPAASDATGGRGN